MRFTLRLLVLGLFALSLPVETKAASDRRVYPVEANEIFIRATSAEAQSLRDQGFDFYDWGPDEIRFVTSWDSDARAVEQLAAAIAAL